MGQRMLHAEDHQYRQGLSAFAASSYAPADVQVTINPDGRSSTDDALVLGFATGVSFRPGAGRVFHPLPARPSAATTTAQHGGS